MPDDPVINNMSPSKRTAAALEGSPMFTPLEVKFKNLNQFNKESAKKHMSGRKYPIIDGNDDGKRLKDISLEEVMAERHLRIAKDGSMDSLN